jgi:hypothetical protein
MNPGTLAEASGTFGENGFIVDEQSPSKWALHIFSVKNRGLPFSPVRSYTAALAMRIIGFAWGAVCLVLFLNFYMRSLTDPTGEVLWMATAFVGTVGAAAIFGYAERSLPGTVRAAAIFAAACWFVRINFSVYRPVLRQMQADRTLDLRYSQRAGEDRKAYCARLVFLIHGPDPILRLGAVRRLERCGADGGPAMGELQRLTADDGDLVLRRAAVNSRKAIAKAVVP